MGEVSRRLKGSRNEIEPKAAIERAWKKDDGSSHSGPGTLSVTVDQEGTAHGTADGALGSFIVSGVASESVMNLRLIPKEGDTPSTLAGVATVTKSASGAEGMIHASSGNSLIVRQAKLTLKKTQ